jgi:transcriptional regulator with XRE-family HTH domain
MSMANEQSPSDVLGDRVRQLRKQRGWSVEQLAERCEEVGAPKLTVSALYAIESGRRDKTGRRRRHVTVEEYLALSLALGVSPRALLLASSFDINITPRWTKPDTPPPTEILTSADPEPPPGTTVKDRHGNPWSRDDESQGLSSWTRDDVTGDPESWTKVAGDYGPVTVVVWGTPDTP